MLESVKIIYYLSFCMIRKIIYYLSFCMIRKVAYRYCKEKQLIDHPKEWNS